MAKFYNSVAGIASHLASLEAFWEVIDARARAHERGEELDDFVANRIWLTKYGKTTKLVSPTLSDEQWSQIYSGTEMGCATEGDVYRYLLEHFSTEVGGTRMVFPQLGGLTDGGVVPRPDMKCPWCKNGWTIENVHDAQIIRSRVEYGSLAEFVGRKLSEVIPLISVRSDGFATPIPHRIRNDKYIDMTPDENMYRYDQDAPYPPKNERGLIETPGGEDHVIEPGDEVYLFSVERFYHQNCYDVVMAEAQALEDQESAEGIKDWFASAGFSNVRVRCTSIPDAFFAREEVQQELADTGDADAEQEIRSVIQWFEVTSDEGKVAILFGGDVPPRLYLEGSGISIGDLAKAVADVQGYSEKDVDIEGYVTYPFTDGFLGGPSVTLVVLGRLLREKKSPSNPPKNKRRDRTSRRKCA